MSTAVVRSKKNKKYFERKCHFERIHYQTGDDMDTNAQPAEMDDLLIKQQIWEKFVKRLQKWQETQSHTSFAILNQADMNPDIMVIRKNGTLLFEPRTPQAEAWLRNRYGLNTESTDVDTGILVHPHQHKQLTTELKAAGFAIAE